MTRHGDFSKLCRWRLGSRACGAQPHGEGDECDHTLEMCERKYHNAERFGGSPGMPAPAPTPLQALLRNLPLKTLKRLRAALLETGSTGPVCIPIIEGGGQLQFERRSDGTIDMDELEEEIRRREHYGRSA